MREQTMSELLARARWWRPGQTTERTRIILSARARGVSRRLVAEVVDLTAARIRQIEVAALVEAGCYEVARRGPMRRTSLGTMRQDQAARGGEA